MKGFSHDLFSLQTQMMKLTINDQVTQVMLAAGVLVGNPS